MWACRIHEAEAKVRGSMDEECDNICRLSCFVVSRVLSDWQAALLYVRAYPYAAHVMVRSLSPCLHCSAAQCPGCAVLARHVKLNPLQCANTVQPCEVCSGRGCSVQHCKSALVHHPEGGRDEMAQVSGGAWCGIRYM